MEEVYNTEMIKKKQIWSITRCDQRKRDKIEKVIIESE